MWIYFIHMQAKKATKILGDYDTMLYKILE